MSGGRMRLKMSAKARRELLLAIRTQYMEASWSEKKRLLDGLVAATGYNRKHALTLLSKGVREQSWTRRRSRKYNDEVVRALTELWKAANRICGKRLIPFLPTLVASLEKFGHLAVTKDTKDKLLSISPATADRILSKERRTEGKGRGRSTTRPGHLVKKQIAVRTFADWNEITPGFLEADLVAHCGDTVRGQFLHTLTMTDIATGWTELGALLMRTGSDVLKAVVEIKRALPFPMLGFDTDNGGEFINYDVLNWCSENKVTFTRSREYRKNDQAHVEEKNGSIVRRLIGYDRYEGRESWQLLSSLYQVSRLYVNFFQPCLKLASKDRNGALVRKRYEKAQTPFERVLNAQTVSKESKDCLQELFDTLDPVFLLREMERCQTELWKTSLIKPSPDNDHSIASIQILKVTPEPSREQLNELTLAELRPRRKRKRKTQSRPRLKKTPGKRGCKTMVDTMWPELEQELARKPNLTSRKLMSLLCERYPDKFRPTQLSVVKRRLQRWRKEHLEHILSFPEAAKQGLHSAVYWESSKPLRENIPVRF
jgi:hypothetical protein